MSQEQNNYQRPKQQPKQYQGANEPDYIVLGSDNEDTDDYATSNHYNDQIQANNIDLERSIRIRNYQLRRRTMTNTIDSNRFFTDPLNPFYIKNFLDDQSVYVMDAKLKGNIGRYFNHSCGPNVFVQNVFVDSYDLRFPWIAFFTSQAVRAGVELCWDYNYTIGSVQGKRLNCHCSAPNCRGRLL